MGGRPVVMVGLDGAAWPLVERWAAEGRLPALASLRAGGTLARVRCPEAFNDNAMWASFSTGLDPVNHGWLHHHRVRPGGYEVERARREVIDGPSFWQVASDAGRTVTVLDVPKSPRGRGIRGVELHDWQVHGPDSPVPLSDPPGVAEEVAATRASPHPANCLVYGLTGDELAEWVDRRVAIDEHKGDLVLEQLAARDADLVVAAFSGAHCAGHQCWHLHDPTHPDHDPALVERLGDPVQRVYEGLDRQVGRVLDAVDDEATVVAFTCLGMTSGSSEVGVLEEVLLRLDPRRPRRALTPHGAAASIWRRLVPRRVRAAMPGAWHRTARRREAELRARSSYWAVDCGTRVSGVRVNLAGREGHGLVDGAEEEDLLADLEAGLRELVDADDGTPLVEDVVRTAGAHDGRHPEVMPDLFVHWAPSRGPRRAARSPRVGEVSGGPADRTGHHHAHGFALARGPGIAAGARAPDIAVTDLAPTALDLLGVDLPPLDGDPVPAFLPSRREVVGH